MVPLQKSRPVTVTVTASCTSAGAVPEWLPLSSITLLFARRTSDEIELVGGGGVDGVVSAGGPSVQCDTVRTLFAVPLVAVALASFAPIDEYTTKWMEPLPFLSPSTGEVESYSALAGSNAKLSCEVLPDGDVRMKSQPSWPCPGLRSSDLPTC